MAVLIDANVLVFAASEGGIGARCQSILDAIGTGEYDGQCSTAVIEEVWHLELSGRIPELEGHSALALEIFRPLLPVTEEVLETAMRLEAPPELGANDRVHVATCLVNGIDSIVTADRAFDTVVEVKRIDPLDLDLG